MNIPKLPRPFSRMLPGMFFIVAASITSLPAQRIVTTEPNTVPVVVESAAISTEVTGRIAVTTFDLVFHNPNNRVLEGSFEFRLLEGQSVVGFSLDINGRQREAVPVEKNRGRVVFEEIVRRGVDPALLEHTAGNNYRVRIYPIPAQGIRRVVISYQEDLAPSGADPVYRLALDFREPLKNFRLSVNVQTGIASAAKTRTTLPLDLPAWREAQFLEVERTQFTARGVFELELPRIERPQGLTERRGEKEYFYAEIPMATGKPVARPIPSMVGLLWDASGSGRDRDHEKEFALLDAWFATVREVEVKLIAFRDRASAPVSFKVENGKWEELRHELKNMAYDGATSFDGLADDPTVSEWLMFSDGLVNYGVTQTAPKLPLRAPVHTVLASPQANPALLRGLAQRQAGEFVNLLNTAPEAAARLLRNESWRVLRIEHDPEQIAQIFPDLNTAVSEGSFVVTGILKARTATIRLRLGHNATDARGMELTIRSGENPSRLAARAWAATKITSLETDLAANREDIRRTSQEFGIVTADTSLIVLETLQDYLRYDIAPPEELRDAWHASRRSATANRLKGQDAQLDRIARLFSEKAQWWETKFSPELQPAPSSQAAEPTNRTATPPVVVQRQPKASKVTRNRVPTERSELPKSLEEEVVVLSPFVVEAGPDRGYHASGPLGNRRTSNAQATVAAQSNNPIPQTQAVADSSSITLQRWESQAGYLNRLRRAAPEKRYSVYREERSDHLLQPGYFLDCAEFFFEANEPELALRILSNLAELQLEDPALLRVLAHRLVQADQPELAKPLLERVLSLRPEEPQSRRDLALVCSTLKQHQRAVDLLWEIVSQVSDGRFPEIELIALGELNAIVATCGERLDLSRIDARFLKNLPVGLRVILTWDADACDMDLWVDDPNGEQAIYSHPRTRQGGRMSRDFTGGYGPEEFLLRNPAPGRYSVRINYFGDRRQTALGPVTAQIRLITGFGTTAQKEQLLTIRLSERRETLEVGEIQIGE